MESIGRIVRLQIQQAGLKVGAKERRRYDPSPILSVSALSLAPAGVTAEDERGTLVDVHHAAHPAAKNAGVNGVSVGFTAHYDIMRARFGEHLTDGIAGENILIETDRMVEEADLRNGLVISTRDGERVHLVRFLIAEPCVEFTRYALRYPHDSRSDGTVATALSFLRNGMRGFYASYAGSPITIRLGDPVFRG